MQSDKPRMHCYTKKRFVLAAMCFFVNFNTFSTRSNLNVAIVAMVNNTHHGTDEIAQNNSCPSRGVAVAEEKISNGVFNWSRAQQGVLLGSYYYGYVVSNIPGAWVSQRCGFVRVIAVTQLTSAVLTLAFPAFAHVGLQLLNVNRILHGLLQGAVLPSMIGAWGIWAPAMERSMLVAVTFAGMSCGTCVTLFLGGLIAENLGWEAVFYVTGGASALCGILWMLLIHQTPESHPRISKKEKEYIARTNGYNVNDKKAKSKVPWKAIFTSPPILAIFISHFCNNWGSYTLFSMLPTYMASVLQFDVAASGLLSSLPYWMELAFAITSGYISDFALRRGLASTAVIRKVNTSLGTAVPALTIVLAGYIGCNAAAAVAFFTLALGFNALTISGMRSNAIDVAPDYSGIIFGISNTFASMPGFLAPLVAGIILNDGDSIVQWQAVFWITAAVFLLGAAVFCVLGSGEVQEWAKKKSTENKELEDKLQDTKAELVIEL